MVPHRDRCWPWSCRSFWDAAPAGATATLTCNAEDRNLRFDLIGNIGSGDGASVQAIEGTIKLRAVRGKFDAIEFKVGPGHIAGTGRSARNCGLALPGRGPRRVGLSRDHRRAGQGRR